MPKAKKSMKLRDQKPAKDPVGGHRHGPHNKQLNSAGTEGSKDQHRRHGGGRNHF
jgi:hypothetical protein